MNTYIINQYHYTLHKARSQMIVNIRIFVENLLYRKNINNEQNRAKNRASWTTMYVKIRMRKRGVNIHRICSRLNNIHKLTLDLTVYINLIKSNRNNIVIESIKILYKYSSTR